MAKKTTNTKPTAKKAAAKKTPAKKAPRMSASAARAEGAATTERTLDAKVKGGKPARAKKPAKDATPKRPSGLDLAAKVLADAGEPLAAKAIAERAIAAGWKTDGKTPHATLYAAIIREIARKGDAARFRKTDRGLFVAAGKGA